MKTAIAFVAFGALLAVLAGAQVEREAALPPAATGSPAGIPATQPSSGSGCIVNDLRVEVALFGSGTHLADVTDRVVQLLRSEPQGFVARADWLQIDPAPGKNKSLLIRYRYHDQERLYMVTGQNRARYALLVEQEK